MVDGHTTNTESEGAVTRLLEREPPEGYRAEWTRHVAEHKTVNTAELRSCMVFRIGTSFLAVPTNVVEVVAEDSAFHTIPQRRSGIALTLTNVRGELLLCVSLDALLGIGISAEVNPSNGRKVHRRLIACRKQHERFAFPVDEIVGVEHYRADQINDLPATLAGSTSNYTRGLLTIRNRTIAFLDEDLLFAALGKNLL